MIKTAMITKEAQRMQLLNKLEPVKDDETICLWGWEISILLEMIKKGGGYNAENTAADGKSTNESNED